MTQDPMTREERADRRLRIAQAVKGKLTLAGAVKRFKVTPQHVRTSCAEHGVPLQRQNPRWSIGQSLKIAASLQDSDPKLGFATIARRLHVTRERVRQVYMEARRVGLEVGIWGKGGRK